MSVESKLYGNANTKRFGELDATVKKWDFSAIPVNQNPCNQRNNSACEKLQQSLTESLKLLQKLENNEKTHLLDSKTIKGNSSKKSSSQWGGFSSNLDLKTLSHEKPLAWRLASHEAKSATLGGRIHDDGLLTKALKNREFGYEMSHKTPEKPTSSHKSYTIDVRLSLMPSTSLVEKEVSDEIKKYRFEAHKNKNQIRGKLDFINSLYEELQSTNKPQPTNQSYSPAPKIQQLLAEKNQYMYSPLDHAAQQPTQNPFEELSNIGFHTEKKEPLPSASQKKLFSFEKATQTPNAHEEEEVVKPFEFDDVDVDVEFNQNIDIEEEEFEIKEQSNLEIKEHSTGFQQPSSSTRFSSQAFTPMESRNRENPLSCKASPKRQGDVEKKDFIDKNRNLSENKRRLSLNYDRALRTIDQTCKPLLVSLKNLSEKHKINQGKENSTFKKSFGSTTKKYTSLPLGPSVLLSRKSQKTITNQYKSFYNEINHLTLKINEATGVMQTTLNELKK